MCYKVESVPLYGLLRYSAWLLTFQFLRCGQAQGGRLQIAQLIYAIGMVFGGLCTAVYWWRAYSSIHGREELGSGGRPTVSSLCPIVWAGICLFGTSFSAGLVSWRADKIRKAGYIWAVVRLVYFLILLAAAVVSIAGAVGYQNSDWMLPLLCSFWVVVGLVSITAALRPTGRPAFTAQSLQQGGTGALTRDGDPLDDSPDIIVFNSRADKPTCVGSFIIGVLSTISWILVSAFLLCCALFALQQLFTGFGSRGRPGEMVEIRDSQSDIRVNVQAECQGARTPQANFTIFLEHGFGLTYLSMKPLADELAKGYQVCGFTRPGYAWSEAGVVPRTAEQLLLESRAVQQSLGLQPPYVLVGHSLGGEVVQLYAQRYPSDVAAIIGLDTVPLLSWWSITYEYQANQEGRDVLDVVRDTLRRTLSLLDTFRFLGSPLAIMSIAFTTASPLNDGYMGTDGYVGNAKRNHGWAMGLDATWNSQYTDLYAGIGTDKLFADYVALEEQMLGEGAAQDTPLLLVPAGKVNSDGKLVTCEEKGLEGDACASHERTAMDLLELQTIQANTSSQGRVVHCPFPCDHALPWLKVDFVAKTIQSFLQEAVVQ